MSIIKNKLVLLALFLPIFFTSTVLAKSNLNSLIQNSGTNVIFLRHALAPGYGDPEDFNINKCNTQRNLDNKGIKQAFHIGKYFKGYRIKFDEILTSEWCRCKDTAKYMNIGKWKTFSGLNSFFQGYSLKKEVIGKLRAKLKELKKENLILMITHQVVINEITGINTTSGGIVLYNTISKDAIEYIIE